MKKHTGFTLIELMVAMAVLAIMLTVGLPQMSIFFKGNRMVANTNEMVSGLNIARSEAIKRGARVSMCKSTNAGTATPTCSVAATGWETGWLVFLDTTAPVGTYNPPGDVIVRLNAGAQGNSPTNTTVTITVDAGDNIGNFVSFTSRGTPKLGNGASQSGVFRICDDRGLTNTSGNVVGRGVVIGASGRARFTKDAAEMGGC